MAKAQKTAAQKAAAKAKAARIKAQAAAPAPQTIEQANEYVRRIGEAQRVLASIEAHVTELVDMAKTEAEEAAAPYKAVIESLSNGVQIYFEANRTALTNDGKIKTVTLAAGKVLWRWTPKAVKQAAKKYTWELILTNVQLMLRDNPAMEKFLRRKVELNKEAMLEDEDLALTVPGVSIEQIEEFVIEPTEVKLQAVQ